MPVIRRPCRHFDSVIRLNHDLIAKIIDNDVQSVIVIQVVSKPVYCACEHQHLTIGRPLRIFNDTGRMDDITITRSICSDDLNEIALMRNFFKKCQQVIKRMPRRIILMQAIRLNWDVLFVIERNDD